MSEPFAPGGIHPIDAALNRAAGFVHTFVVSAAASLVIALNAYTEDLRATRAASVMVVLIALHALRVPRLAWRREYTCYAAFVAYMLLAVLWTRDKGLAMNTLVPATNCIFVMVLFGSLVTYHRVSVVLLGALCGFIAGAAVYTLTQGFPFSYPEEFSYNAIAGMYLFGLFLTLMSSCYSRHAVAYLIVALVVMMHIVATTSIKVNLGVGAGLIAAGFLYYRHFGRVLRRRLLLIAVLAAALVMGVVSNEDLSDKVSRGFERVTIGIDVLQNREDQPGYTGFEMRSNWREIGIEGWKQNPVFGYGTESFRADQGITSHSTPIDVLYNFGLIGLFLFYGMFVLLGGRVIRSSAFAGSGQRPLIFGGVICYLFVSLSGTMHYNTFLSVFIGISAALLSEQSRAARAPVRSEG